jgi:RNA polymerase sigma-70 factor, ECF subfamily
LQFILELAEDIILVESIKNGYEDSFQKLVETHQDMIFRVCYGFVKNADDAEDLTQEVFIQVFKNINSFRGESGISTWMYRIAVNKSINFLRQQKVRKIFGPISNLLTGHENQVSSGQSKTPEQILVHKQTEDALNKAIDSLPENQRTAFILHKYDDLPQQKIAEIMDISVSAVESLIFRAKSNLQQKLSKFYKANY